MGTIGGEKCGVAVEKLKGWLKLLISFPTPPTVYFFTSKDGKTWRDEQYVDWPTGDLWYGHIVTSKNTRLLYKSNSWVKKIVGSGRMLPTTGLFWSVSPSAMRFKSPSLMVSLDARRAYVWSNNVEIDGYFIKCWHLNRDLHWAKW